jgi:hypothetical protein
MAWFVFVHCVVYVISSWIFSVACFFTDRVNQMASISIVFYWAIIISLSFRRTCCFVVCTTKRWILFIRSSIIVLNFFVWRSFLRSKSLVNLYIRLLILVQNRSNLLSLLSGVRLYCLRLYSLKFLNFLNFFLLHCFKFDTFNF